MDIIYNPFFNPAKWGCHTKIADNNVTTNTDSKEENEEVTSLFTHNKHSIFINYKTFFSWT